MEDLNEASEELHNFMQPEQKAVYSQTDFLKPPYPF